MKTNTSLLYLRDSYLYESIAKVVDIIENEHGIALILDQTIFYPQGGGQPSDSGSIVSKTGRFDVTSVRLDENGLVFHYGDFVEELFKVGEDVRLFIDVAKRILHSKLHSAGHLLDCATEIVGLNLKPTKGYHFPDGPYVEYEGVVDNVDEIKFKLQVALDEMIDQNLKVIVEDIPAEEALQRNFFAPAGKSVRIVNFEGFDVCGCGGTHIRSAHEIGKIYIRKLKSKKGNTRISYSLE